MAESPTFPVTIHYFGRAVPIAPDPMAAYWVRGVVGGLGLLAITDLGLLVLALGWPASVVPPWAQEEQAAVEAHTATVATLRGELAMSAKLGQTDADRAEIRRELADTARKLTEAQASLKAAAVADIPASPEERATAAARVRAALEAAGVPAVVVAGWAATLVAACRSAADAGWARWADMEAAGFSTAPAGMSSSGAFGSPDGTPAMPSAGSP